MRRNRKLAGSLLLAASMAVVSCGSGKDGGAPADAGAPDAPNQPIVGGKLGQVLASAAAAASSGAPSAKDKPKDGEAPPETGIFGPGEADRLLPKDGPPKLDVISEGSDPKVQLAPKLDAPEQKATLQFGIRINQGRLPAIDFALSIKPDKGAADKAGDKPKDAAAGPVRMAVTVTSATVAATAGVPKDFGDAVAKLKGAVVRYDLAPNGATSNFTAELPKDVGEGLELVSDALIDAVSMFTVPLPSKPIGENGYWIVGDRARAAAGVEVVRYRVFKVVSVAGGEVTLAVDIRQYSADQKLKLDNGQGQKNEMAMVAFDSQGKGTYVWKADSFLPVRADFSERLGAQLAMPGQPPQPQGRGAPVVQTEVTASIGGGSGVELQRK